MDTSMLRTRYQALYAGVVYDALYYDVGYRARFVIDRDIGMLSGSPPVVGPAFTCWGTRPSACKESAAVVDSMDLARLEIFEAIQPGDVVMMDTDRDKTIAHFGDITAQIMAKSGVAGVVIDGYTRDVGKIRAMDFPLFARGSQPQDAYGKWGLLRHGLAIQFETTGGNRIIVEPGDWIFADADGVLEIPRAMVEEVCEKAERRMEKENEIRQELQTHSLREVYERLGRW